MNVGSLVRLKYPKGYNITHSCIEDNLGIIFKIYDKFLMTKRMLMFYKDQAFWNKDPYNYTIRQGETTICVSSDFLELVSNEAVLLDIF